MYHGDDVHEEPAWVQQEREQFKTIRDADGDGYLSLEEVSSSVDARLSKFVLLLLLNFLFSRLFVHIFYRKLL